MGAGYCQWGGLAVRNILVRECCKSKQFNKIFQFPNIIYPHVFFLWSIYDHKDNQSSWLLGYTNFLFSCSVILMHLKCHSCLQIKVQTKERKIDNLRPNHDWYLYCMSVSASETNSYYLKLTLEFLWVAWELLLRLIFPVCNLKISHRYPYTLCRIIEGACIDPIPNQNKAKTKLNPIWIQTETKSSPKPNPQPLKRHACETC